MPIVAEARFQINAKDDDTIEIQILEELREKGCIDLQYSARQAGTSVFELKKFVSKLVGEDIIECTDESCCVKTGSLSSLVEKLNQLRGTENG